MEVQAKLAGTKLPQRYVDAAQVDRFIQHGYTTRELIEEHNLEFQTLALGSPLRHGCAWSSVARALIPRPCSQTMSFPTCSS